MHRYENETFDGVTIPITPNYNLSSPDKTQHIRQNPPLSQRAHCWENQVSRLQVVTVDSADSVIDPCIA
jgi:hypothetical protein